MNLVNRFASLVVGYMTMY